MGSDYGRIFSRIAKFLALVEVVCVCICVSVYMCL